MFALKGHKQYRVGLVVPAGVDLLTRVVIRYGAHVECRRLGRTGHQSSVGILGRAAPRGADAQTTARAFEPALAVGVDHLDVASQYGQAQRLLGSLVSPVCDQLFVALSRYDFAMVMFPVDSRVWSDALYRRDAEAPLQYAVKHDVGALNIKAPATRPWADRPRTSTRWCEPHTAQQEVVRGVRLRCRLRASTPSARLVKWTCSRSMPSIGSTR